MTELRGINATVGLQSPVWVCSPDGSVLPPAALVRGRNAFAGAYAISIDPNPGAIDLAITASGTLLAAVEWQIFGKPLSPDCGVVVVCADDLSGTIIYAPSTSLPLELLGVLNMIVPTPTRATSPFVGGGIALAHRRLADGSRPPVTADQAWYPCVLAILATERHRHRGAVSVPLA